MQMNSVSPAHAVSSARDGAQLAADLKTAPVDVAKQKVCALFSVDFHNFHL